MAEKIVVSRHSALVAYLLEQGLVDESVNVFAHANEKIVRGKHVIGNVPLSLAAVAESVTIIPFANLPFEKRGKELSLEDVRYYAQLPRTYKVTEVK